MEITITVCMECGGEVTHYYNYKSGDGYSSCDDCLAVEGEYFEMPEKVYYNYCETLHGFELLRQAQKDGYIPFVK